MLFCNTTQIFGPDFDPETVTFHGTTAIFPEELKENAESIRWLRSNVAFVQDASGSLAIALVGEGTIEINESGMPLIVFSTSPEVGQSDVKSVYEAMKSQTIPAKGIVKLLEQIAFSSAKTGSRSEELVYLEVIIEKLHAEIRFKYEEISEQDW